MSSICNKNSRIQLNRSILKRVTKFKKEPVIKVHKKLMNVHFFLAKLGAVRTLWPEHLDANFAFIQFADGSTFQPRMRPFTNFAVPSWMNAPPQQEDANEPDVYVRFQDGEQLHFELGECTIRGSENHNPAPYPPHAAEIRFEHNSYFVAEDFKKFTPQNMLYNGHRGMPPENHIYVKLPHFPIYSSPLESNGKKSMKAREKQVRQIDRNGRRIDELLSRREISSPNTSPGDIYVEFYKKQKKWK